LKYHFSIDKYKYIYDDTMSISFVACMATWNSTHLIF